MEHDEAQKEEEERPEEASHSRLFYCSQLTAIFRDDVQPQLIPTEEGEFDPTMCPRSVLELTMTEPRVLLGPENVRHMLDTKVNHIYYII